MDVFGTKETQHVTVNSIANELEEIDSGCKRLHLRTEGPSWPHGENKKKILAYFKPNVSKGLATLVKQ